MKSKAKPVKGSARTKRFDVGGTVGALAGLGTLAYLMSRKKKGEEGKELGKLGKFPQEAGDGTSGPGMADRASDTDAGRQRALAASKGLSDMVPEGADKSVMESDVGAKRVGTTPAPRAKKVVVPKQGSVSTTGIDAGIAAGNKARPTPLTSKPNEERPSKPYPEKEAAAKKAADKEAAIKKGSTFKGRSANPIQGTIDSASKSMARTPAQKMAEHAREVQRRREEAEKSRYKKGGNVKKYADGGVTSSKPEPKKAPMPAFAREAKENRERDQRVKKEQDAYDKGEKTRLKEQGSMFKSGGMTASKRGDGIAMRGKTRGKMY